jgi:hypothetical protein
LRRRVNPPDRWTNSGRQGRLPLRQKTQFAWSLASAGGRTRLQAWRTDGDACDHPAHENQREPAELFTLAGENSCSRNGWGSNATRGLVNAGGWKRKRPQVTSQRNREARSLAPVLGRVLASCPAMIKPIGRFHPHFRAVLEKGRPRCLAASLKALSLSNGERGDNVVTRAIRAFAPGSSAAATLMKPLQRPGQKITRSLAEAGGRLSTSAYSLGFNTELDPAWLGGGAASPPSAAREDASPPKVLVCECFFENAREQRLRDLYLYEFHRSRTRVVRLRAGSRSGWPGSAMPS